MALCKNTRVIPSVARPARWLPGVLALGGFIVVRDLGVWEGCESHVWHPAPAPRSLAKLGMTPLLSARAEKQKGRPCGPALR